MSEWRVKRYDEYPLWAIEDDEGMQAQAWERTVADTIVASVNRRGAPTPEVLAAAMVECVGVNWPKRWTGDDFAWVARQVAGEYRRLVGICDVCEGIVPAGTHYHRDTPDGDEIVSVPATRPKILPCA